ncbi:hypothetical protein [Tenacibaculum finnmarkense]|uniref:hypothetical protein n=1 Tax=Tenacibaculum finnmarkense TaxID=2781243 RepID=UPI001F44F1C4|nr:hypothetical protein [Tenacibaculum finnmarkense]
MKNPIIFFSLLMSANIIGYVFNIIISKLWDKRHKHNTSTSKKEVLYSLLILLINILYCNSWLYIMANRYHNFFFG